MIGRRRSPLLLGFIVAAVLADEAERRGPLDESVRTKLADARTPPKEGRGSFRGSLRGGLVDPCLDDMKRLCSKSDGLNERGKERSATSSPEGVRRPGDPSLGQQPPGTLPHRLAPRLPPPTGVGAEGSPEGVRPRGGPNDARPNLLRSKRNSRRRRSLTMAPLDGASSKLKFTEEEAPPGIPDGKVPPRQHVGSRDGLKRDLPLSDKKPKSLRHAQSQPPRLITGRECLVEHRLELADKCRARVDGMTEVMSECAPEIAKLGCQRAMISCLARQKPSLSSQCRETVSTFRGHINEVPAKHQSTQPFTESEAAHCKRTHDQRPNILFIQADDFAKATISAYKSHLSSIIKTPHIDALAAEGALFEKSFVTNSLCAPSRTVILTGLHSHENSVVHITQNGFQMAPGVVSYPEILRGAGYTTAQFGKYHSHDYAWGSRAFEHFRPFEKHIYINPKICEAGGASCKPEQHKGFETVILSGLARNWLRDQRSSCKPFYLEARRARA